MLISCLSDSSLKPIQVEKQQHETVDNEGALSEHLLDASWRKLDQRGSAERIEGPECTSTLSRLKFSCPAATTLQFNSPGQAEKRFEARSKMGLVSDNGRYPPPPYFRKILFLKGLTGDRARKFLSP